MTKNKRQANSGQATSEFGTSDKRIFNKRQATSEFLTSDKRIFNKWHVFPINSSLTQIKIQFTLNSESSELRILSRLKIFSQLRIISKPRILSTHKKRPMIRLDKKEKEKH